MRTLNAAFLATDDDRLEELIVLSLLIPLLDCLDGVGTLLTHAKDETLQSNLVSLPSLITIHSVVAADHRRDLSNTDLLNGSEKLLHVASTGLGISITTVAKEVDIDLGDAGLLGGLEESIEMCLLRVLCQNNWSVGDSCRDRPGEGGGWNVPHRHGRSVRIGGGVHCRSWRLPESS